MFQTIGYQATASYDDDVTEVGTNEYCVNSSSRVQTYDVNVELLTSAYEVGRTGAPCKYQAAVVKK